LCIGIQGELRDHKNTPADIIQAEVHLSAIVFEHPERGTFVGQETCILLAITLPDPQQDHKPASNPRMFTPADDDIAFAYALDDSSHGSDNSPMGFPEIPVTTRGSRDMSFMVVTPVYPASDRIARA
jgi:hypothetical protein